MMIPDLSPLWISLKVSLFATFITASLGTLTAYRLYRYQGRGRSGLEAILMVPLLLPPTVVGFGLLLLLGNQGVLGKLLAQWQVRLVFTWQAAVLAAIVVSFPIMYRAALGAFAQIDPLLLDAARLEGASEGMIFWLIALPLAIPGILSGVVLTFARALGEFGATLIVAGNIPQQTQTIPMAIYFAVEAGAMQEAGFWAMVVVLIALASVMVINRI